MRDLGAEWVASMRRGDWDSAWAVSDTVLAGRGDAVRDDPGLPYHRRFVWDGREFRGRHVLVRCYHGLGDTLQFSRFLPRLRPLVASLTLEAPRALLGLLASVPGPDRLVAFDPAAPMTPSECDLEIMELAHALRLTPGEVPPFAPPVRPAALPEGTIGLCWRAGDYDARRSVPEALLARIAERHGCVTLQPLPTRLPVLNPDGCPPDIRATASLLAATRCVVTVDTMVAHLAGSLRHPAHVLLRHDADWRWMQGRDDTPWYPSLRLYRQERPGEWGPVLDRVSAALPGEGC